MIINYGFVKNRFGVNNMSNCMIFQENAKNNELKKIEEEEIDQIVNLIIKFDFEQCRSTED